MVSQFNINTIIEYELEIKRAGLGIIIIYRYLHIIHIMYWSFIAIPTNNIIPFN